MKIIANKFNEFFNDASEEVKMKIDESFYNNNANNNCL